MLQKGFQPKPTPEDLAIARLFIDLTNPDSPQTVSYFLRSPLYRSHPSLLYSAADRIGSPCEITMAQWQSRVENAAILDKSTGYKLLDLGTGRNIDELDLGTGRNSLMGRLKDTDYPEGTFDQPMTEKPKRFESDSGKQKRKQKRKHLVILKGKDSARGSEGEITEESLEEDFKESLLIHMLEYNACFAKIPVSDNHGDEVVVLQILPDPDMLEEEEVVFEILSNYDTSTVESETEDAESLYSLEDERDPEDSIKDEYYIDDDSDDVEYNDRPRTIAPYIEDAPFVVADSGEYNEGACVADLPMRASGDC